MREVSPRQVQEINPVCLTWGRGVTFSLTFIVPSRFIIQAAASAEFTERHWPLEDNRRMEYKSHKCIVRTPDPEGGVTMDQSKQADPSLEAKSWKAIQTQVQSLAIKAQQVKAEKGTKKE